MAIVIVTHNVYWFGGVRPLGGQEQARPRAEIVAALGRLYASLRPDLLCLQEVPDAATARMLRRYRSVEAEQLSVRIGGQEVLLSDHPPQVAMLDESGSAPTEVRPRQARQDSSRHSSSPA